MLMPKSNKEEEDYMSNITSPIYDSASKSTEKYRLGSFFLDDDSATAERDAPPNGTNTPNGAENKTGVDERQKQPAGDYANSSVQHNSAALNGNTVDADRHEQIWLDFVKAANENGRNNSMMPSRRPTTAIARSGLTTLTQMLMSNWSVPHTGWLMKTGTAARMA